MSTDRPTYFLTIRNRTTGHSVTIAAGDDPAALIGFGCGLAGQLLPRPGEHYRLGVDVMRADDVTDRAVMAVCEWKGPRWTSGTLVSEVSRWMARQDPVGHEAYDPAALADAAEILAAAMEL